MDEQDLFAHKEAVEQVQNDLHSKASLKLRLSFQLSGAPGPPGDDEIDMACGCFTHLLSTGRARPEIMKVEGVINSNQELVEEGDEDGWQTLRHNSSGIARKGKDLERIPREVVTQQESLRSPRKILGEFHAPIVGQERLPRKRISEEGHTWTEKTF